MLWSEEKRRYRHTLSIQIHSPPEVVLVSFKYLLRYICRPSLQAHMWILRHSLSCCAYSLTEEISKGGSCPWADSQHRYLMPFALQKTAILWIYWFFFIVLWLRKDLKRKRNNKTWHWGWARILWISNRISFFQAAYWCPSRLIIKEIHSLSKVKLNDCSI